MKQMQKRRCGIKAYKNYWNVWIIEIINLKCKDKVEITGSRWNDSRVACEGSLLICAQGAVADALLCRCGVSGIAALRSRVTKH